MTKTVVENEKPDERNNGHIQARKTYSSVNGPRKRFLQEMRLEKLDLMEVREKDSSIESYVRTMGPMNKTMTSTNGNTMASRIASE